MKFDKNELNNYNIKKNIVILSVTKQ